MWKPEHQKNVKNQARCLLNKATNATLEKFTKEFNQCIRKCNKEQLTEMAQIFVNKAVNEPMYCPLYAKILKNQIDSNEQSFKKVLINHLYKSIKKIPLETGEKSKGIVIFIAELCKNQIVEKEISQRCCRFLVQSIDEEHIMAGVELMKLTGKLLNEEETEFLDECFEQMGSVKPFCSKRTRFLIDDLFEMRMNCWMTQYELKEATNQVHNLLNMVPAASKELQNILSFNLHLEGEKLEQVVETFIKYAVLWPLSCSFFVKLFRAKVTRELCSSSSQQSPFRNFLLTRTQKLFQEKMIIDEAKQIVIDEEIDPEKRKKLIVNEKEKFKRRRLGVVVLIGHLYLYNMVDSKIIITCIRDLLSSIISKKCNGKREPLIKDFIDDDSVMLGLKLIEIVGRKLDEWCPKVLNDWMHTQD
ncbi:hypothetical protein CAEBREN_17063 [Caenorhabditis brenneri]|uniref:MIF4G domain-containing protein n=1 Tax=Caenorhabditis brenneri TaxID=135651 RepID=G0N429_CAEBE|nr:hypothetical protein CAEBREN_17063 [Caenorhabditis brenneri]